MIDANDGNNLDFFVNNILDEADSKVDERPRPHNDEAGSSSEDEAGEDESDEELFGYDSDADPEYLPSGSDSEEELESKNAENNSVNGGNVDNVPADILVLTWGPVDENSLNEFQ